ncbi:Uncharacterized conserved protein (DUF2358) [Seminavis robusta]|uniref:Uncharacterized conserved protein (DUF2358) n=1 Tax=Seminavis robusta TaxID=568900 RepID=A0A9N8D714_9STRA|nr:Uncharacterized conserved protein (DUF2358) [Seminavis robusta]|eukprot:Sro22_g015270.1 Uncharacterized conserved protein (DUF2358) (251) ;mRNA; r:57025-57777
MVVPSKIRQMLLLLTCLVVLLPFGEVEGWSAHSELCRRKLLARTCASFIAGATVATPSACVATYYEPSTTTNELPLALRDFTKLAPLGKEKTIDGDGKTLNLSLTELAKRLEEDLSQGHTGQGGYFISADIDETIFRDDCVFVDPTNRVASLSQYRNALRILFDPNQSTVDLLGPIEINEQERTLIATIRSQGVLQLPWKPSVSPYESSIVYSIDDLGLVKEQSQTWSKSATKALQESFTPSFFRAAKEN